jgi:deoxycytidine triphosphate deaminase
MPNNSTRRDTERRRLLALLAKRPKKDSLHGTGVLLSDAIQHYVKEFDLISPFHTANLKPANYKLTIGDEYAIGGKINPLSDLPGQNEIRIKPFEVAIIKTNETLNVPPFLIARWNIQVSRAYQGLLWVGGPQVDAGYVGHLFCPIYNLSDEEVILHQGEAIAVIDFVKTTHFVEGVSQQYLDGKLPDRILFEDYQPQKLKSALATKAEQEIEKFKSRLETIQTRMDTFVTVTFAIIALLFAALTLFVGKPGPSWWDPTVFWISAITLALSMLAWVRSGAPGTWFASRRMNQWSNWILVVVLIVIAWSIAHRNQAQIQDLREEIKKLQKMSPPPPGVPALPPVVPPVPR